MVEFSNNELIELKKFLYEANYIHDAEIISITHKNNSIFMMCNNLYFKKSYTIRFDNVKKAFFDNEEPYNENEMISSLTLGFEDFGMQSNNVMKDNLKILIEKFSGKRIYIICEKILFMVKTGDGSMSGGRYDR